VTADATPAGASARTAVPRLHVATDDAVLCSSRFVPTAARLLERFGPRLALHVRGHATGAAALLRLFSALQGVSSLAGTLLVVNDRVDVALAARAAGVQLGAGSLPVEAVRRLLPDAWIGYSVHSLEEATLAAGSGTDCLLVGTIYASTSHPGRDGAGPALVEAVVEAVVPAGVPVLAIGGVTPERVAALAAAGAYGVAVLGGVWHAADPTAAAHAYILAIEKAWGEA
jgi:thiamine-phosphate diphosphorylase